MLVHVDRGSATPLSRQLTDQLRAQVLSGRAAAGSALPSVRSLARALAIHPNTVLRVYEQLAEEQLIDLRHGEGTFVVARPPTGRLHSYRMLFADEFRQLLYRGELLGFTPQELREQFQQALSGLEGLRHVTEVE